MQAVSGTLGTRSVGTCSEAEGSLSHSCLRAALPACQGVGVLKLGNLLLFPSSTSKQNVSSPQKSQDRQWETAQSVVA